MATQKRAARRELSPAQRRQQIIEIFATAIASMPMATAVPGKLSFFAPTVLQSAGAAGCLLTSLRDISYFWLWPSTSG